MLPTIGETINVAELDYNMMDYLSRTNRIVEITMKNGEKVQSSIGSFYGDIIFFGKLPEKFRFTHYSIQKKCFDKIKIIG